MKVRDLSNGERLLILRRRNGESQRQAAVRMGTTLYRYRRQERDQEPCKPQPLGSLRLFEACFLTRYRAGIKAATVAAELDVSTEWLRQMEYGQAPCDRLAAFWGLASAKAVS